MGLNHFIPVYFYIYGIFLILGAFFGYRAGSIISLYMGAICGILTLSATYMSGHNEQLAYRLLTGLTGLLSILFFQRLIKTGVFMPAGMLFILSFIGFVLGLIKYLDIKF